MSAFRVVKQIPARAALCCVAGISASALHFLASASVAMGPDWGLATMPAARLECLLGRAETTVAMLACDRRCEPVPWQLDERTADGRLALPDGPEPNPDDPAGELDDNDEVSWMVADSGRRARPDELPDSDCLLEVTVLRGGETGWVYLLTTSAPAPRSRRQYVRYDPVADRIETDRVAIGFGAPTARLLSVRGADGGFTDNRLDRLKVRATAWFLGFIPLRRDEDDIEHRFAAWRVGAIRALRREYQWVRLASWLRTPIFETETLVTRDAMTLPVRLRLNYRPTRFFSDIEILAVLDFRDLIGWRVETSRGAAAVIGGAAVRVDGPADFVALRGPDVTLVLELLVGESLRTLAPSVVYRFGEDPQPPEALPGESPGLGYALTEWSAVDRGEHWFAARAVALPGDADLKAFARERAESTAYEITRKR